MKYRISELIDLQLLKQLMHSLHKATGVPYALVDNASNILIAVGWQDICTKFHRVNEISCRRCNQSDQYILDHLDDGPYVAYRCPQGLMDYATPLVIEGEHLANVFTGQVLNEPPEIDFFHRQADELGFDKPSYLEALQRVPIVSTQRIEAVMAFLVDLAQMLASNGLNRLRQLEAEQGLLATKQRLETQVEERKAAEASALRYAERLQLMTQRIVNVQEEEQRRLAAELHDRVSSTLSVIGVELGNIEGQLSEAALGEVGEKLADCAALVEDALQSTRDVSAALHPAILDYAGLLPALEYLGDKFRKRTGMAIGVTGSSNGTRLPAEKERALFRITQEVLVNCTKHSQATVVSINLDCEPDGAKLSIADNGIGFDPFELSKRGLGLLSIEERAGAIGGEIRVQSKPGAGTQIIVEVRL